MLVRFFALSAITAALLALSVLRAGAHEDYAWVRNPKFVTASGRHCCSEQHCQPAAAGELTPIAGGWRHNPTGLIVTDDQPGIYRSEDPAGRVFRCVYGNELCVFEGSST